MCDYSLFEYKTRLAVEGETLVVHRFHSGSKGLISAADSLCAVCVPHGTKVALCDWSTRFFGLVKREQIRTGVLIQLTQSEYVHRDAIRFDDDNSVCSLQLLPPWQCVKIMSLTPETEEQPVPVPAEATMDPMAAD